MKKAKQFEVILNVLVDDIDPKEIKALTVTKIKKWVLEHFDGCDVATVEIERCTEQNLDLGTWVGGKAAKTKRVLPSH